MMITPKSCVLCVFVPPRKCACVGAPSNRVQLKQRSCEVIWWLTLRGVNMQAQTTSLCGKGHRDRHQRNRMINPSPIRRTSIRKSASFSRLALTSIAGLWTDDDSSMIMKRNFGLNIREMRKASMKAGCSWCINELLTSVRTRMSWFRWFVLLWWVLCWGTAVLEWGKVKQLHCGTYLRPLILIAMMRDSSVFDPLPLNDSLSIFRLKSRNERGTVLRKFRRLSGSPSWVTVQIVPTKYFSERTNPGFGG